jgi:hypothetical protein
LADSNNHNLIQQSTASQPVSNIADRRLDSAHRNPHSRSGFLRADFDEVSMSSDDHKWHNAEHKGTRRALLPLAYGLPCPMCGHVMNRPGVGPKWSHTLALDHVIPRVMGGQDGPKRICHASCNSRAGARLGAAIRRARKPPERSKNPRW